MTNIETIFDTMAYGPAPESDQQARAWLARHGARFGHFIGGRFTDGDAFFESREPATGALLAQVAQGGDADVAAAVQAARAAQGPWAALSGHARARYLHAIARAVQRHARLLAVLETLDNGKPIRESRDIDIPLVARHFYHHAGWAQLQQAEFADQRPVGVVAQIIPWNFPLLMLAWKVAPALALGNTVVLKPAEFTPLTALLFAEITQQIGLPPGVLNIVNGDGSTGAALVAHPDVDKIAFTGSTEVGRSIRVSTAGSGKSLTLELGGKSAFIVFEDADQDAAIEGVVDAIWFNQGQVCCAGARLLVQESIAPAFIGRLRRRMDTLRVGSPLDKSIDMGALIDPMQVEQVRRAVQAAVAEGAELHQTPCGPQQRDACFYPPTLLCNVHPSSSAARDEIFGPVLVSMTFRSTDEAVALANHSRYGLAASVWSESIARAMEVASRLQVGVVWVNATNLFDAAAGFGGYRESGYGREGGREGAYEYLKPRAWDNTSARIFPDAIAQRADNAPSGSRPALDRTAKLYIGGKQVRPDAGHVIAVLSPSGQYVGEVGEGNRKDIRNAVASARSAERWSAATAHHRAQVLYYIAENLDARADEFAANLVRYTACTAPQARQQVDAAISRLFSYAAWADKFEGLVHTPPLHGVVLALHEPIGVVGVICPPEQALLAFISLVGPLIAMGNRVVAVPSATAPLVATDLYQVLETSDLPDGVVNIVTGDSTLLARTLAQHDDVDAVWAFHSRALCTEVEQLSVGNMKRTLVDGGRSTDWLHPSSEGRDWLHHAVQVKNVWVPYGD